MSSDTKNRTIASNTLRAFALRLAGTAVSFLFNVLLARLLGVEGAGVYYLAATIVSISTVLGRVGLDMSLLRFCAAAARQQHWSRVHALYRTGMSIASLVSLLLTACVLLAAPQIATQLFSEPDLVNPLRLLAISIVPMSLLYLHAELFKALRKIGTAMLVQGVAVPAIAICLLLITAPRYGVTGAVVSTTTACVLVLLIAIVLWRKSIPGHVQPDPTFDKRELLQVSTPLFVVGLMNILIDFTDTVMIGYFLTSSEVGLYTVALRVTGLCSLMLSAVNSVVAPEFSALWSDGKKDALQRIARRTTLCMVAAAIVLLCGFLVFSREILLLFGPDFQLAAPALVILAAGQFVVLATGPVAYLLMMTGHEKFHRNNVAGSAIVNIVLNVYLIPMYGIQGAAIATAISLTIKNILAVLFVRSKLGIKVLL